MDDLEKLKRAKDYIDKLANGIDPISETQMPKDTILNNVRLSRCFFYVSDILRQVIEHSGITKPEVRSWKKDFFITDEQKKSVDVITPSCYMKDLVEKINTVTESNGCRKFQQKRITDWLLLECYMEQYTDDKDKKQKRVTVLGESIGLKTEVRNSTYGIYPVTLLSVDAQHFILNNIEAIISESKRDRYEQGAEYQGDPWSTEHEEILIDLFKKQIPVYEIAVTLKRTETGIRARLKKLGLINDRSEAK